MSAARLDYPVEIGSFDPQLGRQPVDLARQLVQPPQAAQSDGGWDGVVGALGHIHMIVGVHRLCRVLNAVAQDLIGAVGNYLVGVHVVAGAGAGLERVHHELVIPAPLHNLLSCGDDGLAALLIEQAQVHVHQRRGLLDHRHAPHEGAVWLESADGEVVHRAHGLGAIQRTVRDFDLAQRILFDPSFAHVAPWKLSGSQSPCLSLQIRVGVDELVGEHLHGLVQGDLVRVCLVHRSDVQLGTCTRCVV